MSSYDNYKRKALADPAVKAEYDALGPEYDIIQAMIDAWNREGLTQKELSDRTGITQADISRIENGTRNPFTWNGKTAGKWPWHEIKDRIHPRRYSKARKINLIGAYTCGEAAQQ